MNPNIFIALILVTAITLLIRAEFHKKQKQIYILKPLATLLVMVIATMSLIRHSFDSTYDLMILAGLTSSLAGDIALMFPENRKAFTSGLRFFLLAHVAYIAAFSLAGRCSYWDALSTVVLSVIGFGFYRFIKANLGAMRLPVIIYIVVISVMVNRAAAAWFAPEFTKVQGILIFLGAALFYISDMILAVARFWRPFRCNRLSLAFYYGGQLLIALSTGWD